MDLETCHCLSIRNSCNWQSYERMNGYDDLNESVTRLKMACFRALWRKIKREKRRFFNNSSSNAVHHFHYDPSSYLQNFDDGYSSTEPDNFARSFSARFAMPSKIFEKNVQVMEGLEGLELEINDDKNNMV